MQYALCIRMSHDSARLCSVVILVNLALLHILLSHECGGARNYVGHYHIPICTFVSLAAIFVLH